MHYSSTTLCLHIHTLATYIELLFWSLTATGQEQRLTRKLRATLLIHHVLVIIPESVPVHGTRPTDYLCSTMCKR